MSSFCFKYEPKELNEFFECDKMEGWEENPTNYREKNKENSNEQEKETEKKHFLGLYLLMDSVHLLFLGDAATGKSSILNVFLKEYYDHVPLSTIQTNVMYINSLKEQGITYYRAEVKTFCQTCSNIKGKKKFIILDDIDLISEQCQQVFRSYMEKYSRNVNFLSSCTNIQKVIESLQSRFNIIKLKPISAKKMHTLCKKVQQREGLQFDQEVEHFVCDISSTSVKTLLNCLEKFQLFKKKEPISLEEAKELCTGINFSFFNEYITHLREKKIHAAIKLFYTFFDNGFSVMDILDNFFLYVKYTPILNENEKYKLIPFICKYIHIFHSIHEHELELALITMDLMNQFI